jgi:hypothetical protein
MAIGNSLVVDDQTGKHWWWTYSPLPQLARPIEEVLDGMSPLANTFVPWSLELGQGVSHEKCRCIFSSW